MSEYNPYESWRRHHIVDDNVLEWVERAFKADAPTLGGWDTETTGLHIKRDYAFLMVFGWITAKGEGRVFTFEPNKKRMDLFHRLSQKLKAYAAWNTSYDLHMIRNAGFEYEYSNLLEGTAVARLVTEAKSPRNGGDTMQLKHIGAKYVHPLANRAEKHVKAVMKELNNERIKVLTAALKQFEHPTRKHTRYKLREDYILQYEDEDNDVLEVKYEAGKNIPITKLPEFPWKLVEEYQVPAHWTKGDIEKFLKDPTQDVEDLPEDVREVWVQWNEDYPEPSYYDVYKRDPDGMITYAGDDVITMLEYIYKARPVLAARKQLDVLDRENRIIMPFHRMEAVGMNTDQEYLKESRRRVKDYIKQKRQRLHELAGEEITVGQHKRIMEILKDHYGEEVESADGAALNRILKSEPDSKDLIEFCKIVKELRTLEKWYSTYILRVIENTSYDGRLYTQINSAGTVSGRVSCDVQQFPKGAIKDDEGNELYCPRKAFITLGDGYNKIVYIDQSQVELRQQADYTIKVSGGDVNLCRAYMPFKCFRHDGDEKIEYDYSTAEKRAEWDKYDWYLNESPETLWEKTDVHAATTHNALMAMGYECVEMHKHYVYKGNGEPHYAEVVDEKEFKKIRDDGKRVNFSKNYGVGLTTLCKNLDIPEDVGQAMIDGYEEAFPGVILYGKGVQKQHARRGYVQNLYGRRYYLSDERDSYILNNLLIQGTCADAMKEAIIGLDTYIIENNLKTHIIIPIHDEVQFALYDGEEEHIPRFREFLEKIEGCLVPIVADVEITETNWYEKEEM